MKITRNKLKVILIVSLCLLVCLGIYKTGIFRKKETSDPITLNVSLYKSLPHYDSFEKTVEECWNEKHPDVKLNFFDWDCYSGTLPENLDVFVLDSITLDSFSQKGYDKNIPMFYMDAAAVSAKISDEKKGLALELVNMITSKDTLVRVSMNNGHPRYLLLARQSAYDTLASDYPIYQELKKLAFVPDAHVFRIKPDEIEYLEEAEKNKDALPSLTDQ